jgi:Mycothiol maleylpyruvate isomerase N-terminal domain
MEMVERAAAEEGLAAAYGKLGEVAAELTETDAMRPSRCSGWAVLDVLYHQLLDARRGLQTFATPATDPPDVDDVSYWLAFNPASRQDAESDGLHAARRARQVRVVASAYEPAMLAWEWRETSEAAVRAARACPHDSVATQGDSLRTADFIATLAVEAAVHYLDLTVFLAAAPAPDPVSLGLVRRVLNGLAGAALPGGWDDVTCALKGTGRLPLTDADRADLGAIAGRLPLFG